MADSTRPPAQAGEAQGGDVILEVRHLTKRFPVGKRTRSKQVHALTDASFVIRRGEVVALVGESGSGKSTTARLITRLIEPTGGEIFLNGQNVLKEERRGASRAYRRRVQMIFQDPYASLNPARTVGFHLQRPLRIHKKYREGAKSVNDLLTAVGLVPAEEFARKYPFQLSGGQRQRVAIARALAVEPKVILADEPISMLDVSIRMGVLNLIDQLKEERDISFLYITHDLASARYIGDRTIVMYAGHMVEGCGSVELMENAAHPYSELLLSAVPNPQGGLSTREVQARGEIPSLIDPPPGCPFAPRCPHVMDICRAAMPEVTELSKDHWVRCYLFSNDVRPGAVDV
jgi:peptide/nickel transport system ATP-binding protein